MTRPRPPRRAWLRLLGLFLGAMLSAAPMQGQETSPPPAPAGAPAAAPANAVPSSPPVAPAVPPAPRKPVRSGLRGYDVGVFVTFRDDPLLTIGLRQEIVGAVRQELEARAGAFWRPLAVEEAPAALRIAPIADDRNAIERLTPALGRLAHDKVFLVAVDCLGGEFVVRGCEWDKSSATLGSWIKEEVTDRRLLAATATRIVGNTFRALAAVESIDGGAAVLELRGAELAPPDPRFLPIREGDSLQPFLRILNRKRELDRIQVIPWTYLQVQEVDRSRAICRVISSFKAPLTPSSRRVELMAVGATPVYEQTTLEITPHGNPQNPVVGARVEILDRLPTKEDPVEDRIIASTDRFGRITMPVDPLKPLIWIYVYSGKSVLARVPVVPGLVPAMSLAVPDDSPRLLVEGELSLLEGEVIDAVGRREVLMARSRQIVKNNKWDEIERITMQIEDLPALGDFERRAEDVRTAGVQASRDHRDKIAEARVNRLVAAFLALVREHLDPDKISAFKDEMAELKRAQ